MILKYHYANSETEKNVKIFKNSIFCSVVQKVFAWGAINYWHFFYTSFKNQTESEILLVGNSTKIPENIFNTSTSQLNKIKVRVIDF